MADAQLHPLQGDHPNSLRHVAPRLVMIVAIFLVASNVSFVSTPDPVLKAFRGAAGVLGQSVGGCTAICSLRTKAIEPGATGSADDENKETAASAIVFKGSYPFIAIVSVDGWGLPKSDYRVWARFQPLNLANPWATVVERGITTDEVASDKGRMSKLISEVLSTCGMSGVYDVDNLVATAKVVPDYKGEGILAVAVILPKTTYSSSAGSLEMQLGRDWQIESFDLWTSDTYLYEHAGE